MLNTLQLVLLTTSLHSPTSLDMNEDNFGVGFEVTQNSNVFGVYAFNNSYYKTSLMVSASKKVSLGDFYGQVGVALASGYEDDSMSFSGGLMVAPELTLGWKMLRVKTTAPFGAMIGVVDVVNFQIVLDLN